MKNKDINNLSRRNFFKNTALSGAAVLVSGSRENGFASNRDSQLDTTDANDILTFPIESTSNRYALDLSPAKWIWYPSRRCLPNTFVLFRKECYLSNKPRRAQGWILGDSRYRLYLNGRRIQWGPAPSDPRWAEAEPIDFSNLLQ